MNMAHRYTHEIKFKKCPGCHTWCSRADPFNICLACPYCTRTSGRSNFCWICLQPWRNQHGGNSCGNYSCFEADNESDYDHPDRRISQSFQLEAESTARIPWDYSAKDFSDAVKIFHDKYARQPSGGDTRTAKALFKQIQDDLKSFEDKSEFKILCIEYVGSSYEGVKVRKNEFDNDLEFDLMVTICGGENLQVLDSSSSLQCGPAEEPGYAYLKTKGQTNTTLQKITKEIAPGIQLISAKLLREKFHGYVKRFLNKHMSIGNMAWRGMGITAVEPIYHGPATQIDVYVNGTKLFSVDLVPQLRVQGEYFIPKMIKHPTSAGNTELLTDSWFRSYSLREKQKFCGLEGVSKHYRKMVFRMMKVLVIRRYAMGLNSHQLKAVFLRYLDEIYVDSDWVEDKLGARLMGVLGKLKRELDGKKIAYYYDGAVNLLKPNADTENMSNRLNTRLCNKQRMMREMI